MIAPLRAVIDTNVVLSAVLFGGGRLAWLRNAWSAPTVVPIVSDATLAELVEVLAYAKFGLSVDERKAVLAHYMEHAEAHRAPRTRLKLPDCRDPEDEIFLRLAYAAGADALVTGDKDLLSLAGDSKITILSPADFGLSLAARLK